MGFQFYDVDAKRTFWAVPSKGELVDFEDNHNHGNAIHPIILNILENVEPVTDSEL